MGKSGPARLRLDDGASPGHATLVVEGLSRAVRATLAAIPEKDPRWAEIVQVYTGEGPPPADQPPLLGRSRFENGRIRFQPRFPLVPGLAHFARFDGRFADMELLELRFELERPQRVSRARVLSIEPGTERVPANLLRVYVHFSEPMRARDVLQHVHLFDAGGDEVTEPFIDIEDGLWDPERTRLTLFFHPGRIKRGVGPNEVLGPPLRPGDRYELRLDADLEDAWGRTLLAAHSWSFRTGPRDDSSPDPHTWILRPPRAASDSLDLLFGESLDQALAARLIRVQDAGGRPLHGEAHVSKAGDRWSWRPREPWERGTFAVIVHPALEDLAGNAVGHRFEERLHGGAANESLELPVRLPFVVH